jgi:PAS domain S-box-containing protein
MQLLIDIVPAMISYIDQQEVFRYVNRAYEEFFGLSPDEILGRTVYDLGGELHYRVARPYIDMALRGQPVAFDSRVQRRDGRISEITVAYKPDYGPNGTVRGFAAMVQDVTERKRAEAELVRSEEQFRKVFRGSPLGMALLASDFRYVQVNPALCRILGYTEQELLELTSIDITHPDDRKSGVLEAQEVFRGERNEFSIEKRYLTAQGASVWVRVHSTLLHDAEGRPWRNLVLIEDVTENKNTQNALAHRTEELVRSNKELEQFAYVISHDLQEPLRTISGYSKLLANRYKGKLDDQAQEFLSYLVGGTQRMSALIRDLLHYSQVTEDVDPTELVNLDEVIKIALLNLEVTIEDAGASVTADRLPAVPGRRIRLIQLFQNLISNALKYRHPERTGQVMIYAEHDSQSTLHICVEDNGIGIAPQHHERIFGIFQRLNGETYSGTGIGLALCRKIVEQHGGRLWVESQLGHGAIFRFTLPRNLL